ncbi:RNA-binding cell elongation regulator Jag/EloR [Halarsenatibacter silvermanii]|uniref:RNA-binding protein KhpB n=1 Tax=Halarsenatibacter silvermanii TaxID=321763 RepID=A0A1G9Q6A9_9FIRM|nr:RNA-binding cell elongation regulator Jag/EloR [Halarsenatibacter silvermanii]SDM06281.1 spoIIIJ-associated protein [Halarsenatibacter silvermanii]
MDWTESTVSKAETVDEAVEKALAELGIGRTEAEIEILDEGSSGLLGIIGKRDAEVKVTHLKKPEDIGREFLEKILEAGNLEVEVEHVKEKSDDEQLYYNFHSDNELGLVIGHRGETLDAFQYLTSLAVNRETESYHRVMLDAEGYRERRRETLERLAEKMKRRAIETGRKVMLDPMPPHERRVIHLAVKDDPRVKTYSEGEEPFRKVLIETTMNEQSQSKSHSTGAGN